MCIPKFANFIKNRYTFRKKYLYSLDILVIKILIIIGTRPDALKMYPLINQLYKYNNKFNIKVCSTNQHTELFKQVINTFNIKIDYNLKIIRKDNSLEFLVSNIILELKKVFNDFKPDLIFVHGDTTTAMAASIVSYYNKIKIFHIEAGIRSYSLFSPFPEEGNRKIITQLAYKHFAPTKHNFNNLLQEGIDKKNIFVVGNTIIDLIKKITSSTMLKSRT